MKVAIVLPPNQAFSEHTPTSTETVIRTIGAASRDRATTTVFCDAGATDHGPFNVCTVATSGGRLVRTMRVIARLRELAPDFIELHQHEPTAWTIAQAFRSTPTALYRHNFAKRPKGLISRLRLNARYKAFSGYIFVSDAARKQFAGDFPAFADRSFAVPNPIDTSLWEAPVTNRDKLIAFAGRAAPEKGLDLLCAALDTVLGKHADWNAELVLGDWNVHEAWAKSHLAPLEKYGDRVRLKYSQPLASVRDTLRRAAISVVPSVFSEPFGLAAIEAHAAGAAVVSSGSGGLREASGDFATYATPVSRETLSAALEDLIANPGKRATLAASGQDFVRREHAPARRAGQLDEIRDRIARQHTAGRLK
jgi:glycosyltransferase involved in cell wall biosynthesis